MNSLRFIIVFAQIVIKGCMESPIIRTILIILSSIAALVFIPYWVGLLVVNIFGIFPSPIWAGGFLCIIVVAIIAVILFSGFMIIYESVESSMRRKR